MATSSDDPLDEEALERLMIALDRDESDVDFAEVERELRKTRGEMDPPPLPPLDRMP